MKKGILYLIIIIGVIASSGYYFFVYKEKDDVLVEPLVEEDIPIGSSVENSLLIVSNDGLYGLVDFEGELIVPLEYDSINYCGSYYIASNIYSFTIFNESGEERVSMDGGVVPNYYYLISCPIDYSPMDESSLIPYETSEGLFGFIDFSGTKVIPTQFQIVAPFNKFGLAYVIENEKFGFIDTDGEYVIEPIYTNMFLFSDDGLVFGALDGKYGYLDTEGNIVLDFIYDSADNFENGYAVVQQLSKFLLIDIEGNIVIDNGYNQIIGYTSNIFYSGLQFPLNGGYSSSSIYSIQAYDEITSTYGWGCIDIEGNVMTELNFDTAFTFTKHLKAIAIRDGLYGLLDENGNEVLAFVFEELKWLDEDQMYLGATNYGQSAIYDYFGDILVGFEYDSITNLYEDVFVFEKDLFFGLSDLEGNVIIEPYYDYIGELHNGLRLVQNDGVYGYINNEGERVINLEYEEAIDFNSSGLAAVKSGGSWGIIDYEGNIVIPTVYDEVTPRE